ncbi:hypothetical protein GGR56DRAFT_685043 [Xylariaceae sp. FL0804]|nr:hypothetical protein GGR56DRAFT_685043 [Xylariaceae sp. FL0804]
MAPVTELIEIMLKPGADLAPIAAAEQLLARQPGCLRIHSSRVHEDRDRLLRMFVVWQSLGAHVAFIANRATYEPFIASLDPAVAGAAPILHAAMGPAPPAVFDNGAVDFEGPGSTTDGIAKKTRVVEFALLYFPAGGDGDGSGPDEPGGFTLERARGVTQGVRRFLDALAAAAPPGLSGETAAGWVVEEPVQFPDGGPECSSCYALAIGWDSVEAHLRFRETQAFADIVPLFHGLDGLYGVKVCHVSCKTTEGRGAAAA